ncbi:hypothetical protein ABZY81_31075 [Streptomyces sp. NPDC006514]|uniref:hypothetical protein n=1 Tax=Streptomyces sp. NPDC006514 TaxID=3154308 RepID=UPI0033BF1C28
MVGHIGLRPVPRRHRRLTQRLGRCLGRPGDTRAERQQTRHHHTSYGTTAHRHHLLARRLATGDPDQSDHHTNEGAPTPICRAHLRAAANTLPTRSAALSLGDIAGTPARLAATALIVHAPRSH